MTRLSLGHSPDSDDAFMFYALADGHITSEGLEFEHILKHIQTLNEWALEGRLDITALSVHGYAYVADRYEGLMHGASMGDGYGPMVIAPEGSDADLRGKLIAVPGEMTSAFLALRLWWSGDVAREDAPAPCPDAIRYRVTPFDAIMDTVRSGAVDAGLIIHEGQLTYAREGMRQIVDLGSWWQSRTGLPLPLGINAIRSDLPETTKQAASAALRDSIVFGLTHRADALRHALQFGRGLDRDDADRFVGMYVNDWTADMGAAGREAIERFLAEGSARGFAPVAGPIVFRR